MDQAEFCWIDETSPDSVFRCWDFQYPWYRTKAKRQIDCCARAIGKSVGMSMRAWAFPFTNPGSEMLLTAPEYIHLDPVTKNVEDRILASRLSREFLRETKTSNGITHRPFQAQFRNGSTIKGRIPQKDGKGVKGCIAEGTIVLTRRGLIPVEDVIVGDEVFTHEHRWRPVLTTYRFEDADCVEVAGGGHRGLVMSDNHRMLCRRNRKPKGRRDLERAIWTTPGLEDAEEITRNYLGSPTAFDAQEAPWPRFGLDLAWVAGRYVADGYLTWQTKGGVRTSARLHVITDAARQSMVSDAFKRALLRPTATLRGNGTYDVEASDTDLCRFLLAHFSEHAESKTLPPWLLGASEDVRRSFLDGYLAGDGHWEPAKRRWTAGTASKSLAVGLRLLAQSLGMSSALSWVDPKVTRVMGRELKKQARRSWRVTMTEGGQAYIDGDSMWQKIRKVTPTTATVYDLGIQEDHSYLADGIYSHNMHPKKLEMDEAQDYPKPGWIELTETLKHGDADSTWRAHGVTRGVRDMYFERTQPESGWFIHRLCLPAGTMIYGVGGPFEIQDAEVGALVWSVAPDGSLEQRPVLARIDNGEKATWNVAAKGGFSLETTPNHPYLILSRAGTRRTRRELAFEWAEAQDLKPGDYLIGVRELESTGVRVPTPSEIGEMLADHSPVREVPAWVWEAPRSSQMAFLAGYLMGDGSAAHQKRGQDPWQVGTSSLRMAKQLRALCHYLGLRTSRLTSRDEKRGFDGQWGPQYRFYVYGDESWFRQIPLAYSSVRDGQMLEGLDKRLMARRVEFSQASGRVVPTYDITVEEHHNYIAEGVVTHNTAMHRPDWTAEEREAKALDYGGRHAPDFKRNILGQHGDEASVLFVLSRLMMCVDTQKESAYNVEEYYNITITEERLTSTKMQIEHFLDFPSLHTSMHSRFWVGMDVGLTNHPSEILVFAESQRKHEENKRNLGETFLKLVTRIHLERISSPNQRRVLEAIWEFYQPQAIAMDRTGLGLPIYQEIRESAPEEMVRVMRPYNFSEKIVIGYEGDADTAYDPDKPYGTEIKANTLEFSSDMLRAYVDRQGIALPWDIDLIKEFQGQTYTTQKSTQSPYGKKVFNQGKFHALDATRMAVLGHLQERVELNKEIVGNNEPVLDSFLVMAE